MSRGESDQAGRALVHLLSAATPPNSWDRSFAPNLGGGVGGGVVFFTSRLWSINFPVLGETTPGLPNPLNFGGLFPFSSMAEDLGLQQSGCSISSSVSSRIKYGVTADNSCSM